MSHVDDGQLNALLDGELTPEAARAVEAHVATCTECARRLEEARAFLSGAGELLALLTPPALAAHPAAPSPPAPFAQPGPAPSGPASTPAAAPKVAKTSKEIAISVDGRTEMTPAIRPVFPHEVAAVPVKRRWNLPDLEKLAWAASLMLCLGVGYLANEVYHLQNRNRAAGQLDIAQGSAPDTSPHAAAGSEPVDRSAGAARERAAATPSAAVPADANRAPGASRPAERRGVVATPPKPPKPRISKPAPTFARPRPEELASNQPGLGREASGQIIVSGNNPAPAQSVAPPAPRQVARPATPAPSVAPPAQPPPGSLADLSGAAGAGAPAVRPNAGAGARSAEANRLDEIVVSSDAPPRLRGPATPTPAAFRRVPMEEAVRHLSGSIRLIDGMNPQRVDLGPGSLVPGADPDRDVVRVTYSANGRRLVLDQQLGDTRSGAAFNGLLQGDTLVTTAPSGSTQVRWIDQKFWLSLTGAWEPDSVRGLLERIR